MKKLVSIILALVLLQSCGLFLSPFSAQSYQYFIELKVLHLKFIESFTESDENEYNQPLIKEFYNIIDLKFREAIEYQAQVTEDNTRLTAFEILREEFEDNYNVLTSGVKLFSKVYAAELLNEINENYNIAIKGELSRRDTNE